MNSSGYTNPSFEMASSSQKLQNKGDGEDAPIVQTQPAMPAASPVSMVNIVPEVDPIYPSTFTEACFDPQSRGLFSGTYTTHLSYQRLNNMLLQQGAVLQQRSLDSFASLHDRLTYDQLLQGLLFRGETVLNGNRWLLYTCVEFLDEGGKVAILPPMNNGKACLTDQRLLLFSAERSLGAGLSKFGDPKKTPGGYHVETLLTDNVHYKPVPLHSFWSIEMHISSGAKSEANVHAKAPWCCGIFGRCCDGNWTKNWYADAPSSTSFNQRVITLGATLPPWGARSIVRIHLNPNMPLGVAKDFVSCLQCYARHLH